jgi:hypothetical protein
MHFSIKALFLYLAATGFLTFSLPQQNNRGLLTDSVSVSDSAKYFKAEQDSIAAQDSLFIMKKKFDQFKYGDVISIANKLLLKKAPFTRDDIIDIYKLKGISHYSLSEDDAARKSFIEILRMDTSYTFDSTKISPKIISFYNQVKQNYVQQQKEIEARTVVRIDTVFVPQIRYDIEHEKKLKNAVARSLIIPGLGQWYLETNFKNIAFTALGAASLASSIYYVIKTEKDEKAYLIETNPDEIQSKYHEYNNSFKSRNISLITFGVLWVYSQLDLLFFSDDESGQTILKNSSLNYNDRRGLTLNFNYPF